MCVEGKSCEWMKCDLEVHEKRDIQTCKTHTWVEKFLEIESSKNGVIRKLRCGWLGLGEQVWIICEQKHVPDINKYKVQKKEIQAAIFEAHYSSMMDQITILKKFEDIKDDSFR